MDPIAEAKTAEARLTVAFSSAIYTVGEGESATTTVIVTPNADRNVKVNITMTGTGATLSGLTDGALIIARGQSLASFTVSGDQDDDATNDEVTLTLDPDQGDYVFRGSPFSATVTIKERNRPPVIATTSPITVEENQTTVATLEATDSDNDPITGWSITGGADSALFDLTNGGVLSFKTAPDYENPNDNGRDNGYEVEVTASDGTDNSDPLMITVTVTDLNEPPGAPTGLSVSPNEENPTTALDVTWTAPGTTGIPPSYRATTPSTACRGRFGSLDHHTTFDSDGNYHQDDSSQSRFQHHVPDPRCAPENHEGEGQWAAWQRHHREGHG